jgi:hypothetical protein
MKTRRSYKDKNEKKKWSSITSKENTKEWIEKILILKKNKKKLTQVSMSNT